MSEAGGFVWEDAGRTVVFRRDGLAGAPAILAERGFGNGEGSGFVLLSSERALASAPALAAAASAVHPVPAGEVPALAATLLEGDPELSRGMRGKAQDRTGGQGLVALGGGRVVDVAKAVASVSGARVAAIPTTMSGAEMTGNHRLPVGYEERVPERVRPTLVIADPELMTGAPEAALRASSMNALAHGADCLYTPLANPVSRMTALRGAELIATALDTAREARERSDLALGSLLCGYAIDSAGAGLHHPVCQTLVRSLGLPHAETNAAVLPHSAAFLATRAPREMAELAAAIGADAAGLRGRLWAIGGEPAGLGALGAERERLGEALDLLIERPELASVPGPPLTREDLRALIEAPW